MATLSAPSRLGLWLAVGAAVVVPGAARAQGGRDGPTAVVVVDAPRDERTLEGARLRADVSAELGEEAVAPDDPRAGDAAGTLVIRVNRQAHSLMVEYLAHADAGGLRTPSTSRTIALPDDDVAIERAAVLLAGNLARDEASDLAASLRRAHPAASPAPARKAAAEVDEPDDDERIALTRLGDAIEQETARSQPRRTLAEVAFGVGIGAMFASAAFDFYGLSTGNGWAPDAGLLLLQSGDALFASSIVLRPGSFEGLRTMLAQERADLLPPDEVRLDVEQAWARAARIEHHDRRVYGWFMTGVGSLAVAASSLAFVGYFGQSARSGSILAPLTGFAAVSALDLAVGLQLLLSDGPMESALRAYSSSADVSLSGESARVTPTVAPVPGGVVAGVGGRF
jgi:hypothetical protein